MAKNEAWSAIERYSQEVVRLRAAMDLAFGLNVTNNTTSHEDVVIFPLGIAARDLFEEVLFLVHHGYGHAALRTSRTLYECVVFASYIHRNPETCDQYLETMYASWANVLRNVANAEQNLPEMHRTLSEKFHQYRQGKYVPPRLEQ